MRISTQNIACSQRQMNTWRRLWDTHAHTHTHTHKQPPYPHRPLTFPQECNNKTHTLLCRHFLCLRDNVAEAKEILFLNDQIDSLEQYSRRNCVRISPVPETSTDSTDEGQGSRGLGDPFPNGPNLLLRPIHQEDLSWYQPGARGFHGQHR